jgi:class 3 adenylate cyclase
MPETRYADVGGEHVAYQVVGDGPIDAVWVGTWFGHVEARWDLPVLVRFFERLSRFTRFILFDKRGTGMSDPVPLTSLPTLEDWMDDVRAVLDAEGWERAAILASAEGGPLGILFAATYPERTTALVLSETYARIRVAPDYPEGLPDEVIDAYVELTKNEWGKEAILEFLAPGSEKNSDLRRGWARYTRQSASPGTAYAMTRMNAAVDVRHVLQTITVPTLVTKRPGGFLPLGTTRYVADHIAGARFVELAPGDSLVVFGDIEEELGEVEEFLTGVRPMPAPERVLATVMFTDLVDSTARAVELGDHNWTELLERHHQIVRRELGSHRGKEIKTVGDGFLATFDGPARAIHCAGAIGDRLRAIGLEMRAGLHTGECELMGEDVGGIAVHIGARVAALAGAGEVLVSSTVKDLVAGSGIHFADRGVHRLKGVPDEWRLFAVET